MQPEPLVIPLPQVTPPVVALRAFADLPAVLLFESALERDGIGRYSFLTADPFEIQSLQDATYGNDPFAALRASWSRFRMATMPGLPPFQGGAAGLLSYELGHAWECLPTARFNEFQMPALAVGLYDWVLCWDHATNESWIISHGFPETESNARSQRARQRADWVLDRLRNNSRSTGTSQKSPAQILTSDELAPQFAAAGLHGLTSDFPREEYLRAVERVIEYIRAGDIFQANLSQRLLYPFAGDTLNLYARLRACNPAPLAGYFACDDWAVVSASPERFVRVNGRDVETRPIKGTRARRAVPEADLYTRDELRESDKDRAENVMIVDLLRNDLSRVCEPGTIRVPKLCNVETYETVQHLVSEIHGQLAANRDAWDLFAAVFPGGSITGAPKVRAMEIIAEQEPTVRGPYCGSLFYVGFDGAADSSILIRTFVCRNGWIQCGVGGGVVAQSDPAAEYEETLHKAAGMLRALRE